MFDLEEVEQTGIGPHETILAGIGSAEAKITTPPASGHNAWHGWHAKIASRRKASRGEVAAPVLPARPMLARVVPLEDLPALLAQDARLMGLDLGTKTIGLALSDVKRTIASSLLTIERTKFRADAKQLLALAAEYGAGGFVVGLPVNMDGSEGARAQSTRAFVRNLAALTELPLALWDERLTTATVTRTLIEADTSRRRRAALVDKMAAAYLLQGALDRLGYGPPA